jgi:hypothetical protein
MIISHKHKFIFLHSRKCAGSSVKVALSALLGSDDVMIGSWNEARDVGVALNRRAKIDLLHPYGVVGFAAGMAAGKSISESLNIGIKNRYIGSFGRNAAHPSASAAKKYCRDVWDDYMIFSICRNPYERVVSDYLWRVRTTKITTVSFAQYLDDIEGNTNHTGLVHKGAIKNSDIVSIDNESVLDFVCKYENLSEDFEKLCVKLDLGSPVSIGRAKMGSGGKGYNEYHTDETIETVSRLFRWEIETFGYELPYQTNGKL